MPEELSDIVDQNNNPTGAVAERSEAHEAWLFSVSKLLGHYGRIDFFIKYGMIFEFFDLGLCFRQ